MGRSCMSYKKVVASLLVSVVLMQAWETVAEDPEIQVTMWNNMQGRQDMRVHCKGGMDYGIWPLLYHQTYEFKFDDNGYQDDYYCSFDFDGVIHWFDIYLGKRDRQVCGLTKRLCRWVIQENGPCLIDTSTCYDWNHDGHKSQLLN